MTENEFSRLHAFVEGHVQGVGFRAFVWDTAETLDLKGWVRNCLNGDVEVMAEGKRSHLDQLLGSLRRGPRASHVTGIRPEWQPYTGEFSGFSMRRTE